MSMVQFVAGRVWTLKIPAVVRYLEAQYVEDFFATGTLLLSTYKRCVAHEDASRKDPNEGGSNFSIREGDYGISGFQRVGQASFMLCTSMIESDKLMRKFGADAFFRIHDVTAFADVVSRHVAGFADGSMGACVYRPERTTEKTVAGPLSRMHHQISEVMQRPEGQELEAAVNHMRQMQSAELHQQLELDPFFIKESMFDEEAEFRMVWNVKKVKKGTEELFV